MSKLRLMFQNQWNFVENYYMWEEAGQSCSAEVRMRGHVRIMKELLPDVLGGQEVNSEMQRYLKFYCIDEGLPYTQIWGNYTPIIYRADKLNLLDSEYLVYPQRVEGYEGIYFDDITMPRWLDEEMAEQAQEKQSADLEDAFVYLYGGVKDGKSYGILVDPYGSGILATGENLPGTKVYDWLEN